MRVAPLILAVLALAGCAPQALAAAGGRPLPPQPVPQHPFMAPNGLSNTHADAYQTDTYAWAGPAGPQLETRSAALGGVCVTHTFDSQGRLVTACLGPQGPRLVMLDPRTLDTQATLPLPPANPAAASNPLAALGGGVYFFLDNHDRAVLATNNHQIWIVAESNGPLGPAFAVERTYDLSGVVNPQEGILSVLPDWSGRLWFVTTDGLVGTVDPASGAIHTRRLEGEAIANSFAVDETGGVYIASDHAMYRFDAGPAGEPAITWREPYDRGTRRKPGQLGQGTGTTPTLLPGGYVAITDNADPRMHVLVYRTAPDPGSSRLVCSEPVFAAGKGDTENSLIGYGQSLVVENNYGGSTTPSPVQGVATEPGIARVDFGHGCRTAWTSQERAPSSVAKLSIGDGRVYAYTKDADPAGDRWSWTAIDFRTGRTVYRRLVGTGFTYDNFYSAVTLGPDGAGYVGLTQGMARVADVGGP